jgi:uncharacterized protein YkwD
MLRAPKYATALLLLMSATNRTSNRLIAVFEGSGAPPQSADGATLKTAAVSAPDIPFDNYDPDAERALFELANQARAGAGLPPLTLDPSLTQAARIHAEAMVAAQKLSHQFPGEPSLPQRLAAATRIQLDQEGENVALDFDAADGHRHLMLSPPHRANLLSAAYNVIGLGVARSGSRLYIVQDFGHALPNYSVAEVKDKVTAAIDASRRQAKQPALAHQDLPAADEAACSMAQADKLATLAVHQLAQRYTVLTYTSLHPETLPAESTHALGNRNLHAFSIGACYARTETYPTGAYWVLLALE